MQESLANVSRHSRAKNAWISFHLTRGEIRLEVTGDGRGFARSAEAGDLTQAGHFGLVGMRERAQSVSARLQLHSAPGRGTRVTVRLPLSAR